MALGTGKRALIESRRLHETDTGSPEVQVALINTRIRELTEHFQRHKKDHHSRQGLFKLVSRQRRLLRYLYKRDAQRYHKLINELEIRDTISSKIS
jgi:small subunit ribosomal protein S15